MDSIGPRLTGSPANRAANEWLLRTYKAWGVDAKNEQYGTWRDWTRGPSGLELVAPRMRVLEATMHAWSAATPAGGVTADVVIIPTRGGNRRQRRLRRWLGGVKGKLVLASMPQPSCRPDSDIRFWADSAVYHHAVALRDSAPTEWSARLTAAHVNGARARPRARARRRRRHSLELVVARMGRGQDPVGARDARSHRSTSRARTTRSSRASRPTASIRACTRSPRRRSRRNESPVFNTVARIDGSEKPNEYVMLSAHLDSWDAGSGATDNGTGTITMLEAMRILKTAYPHPKRTILVGHWSGEEEGDIGSVGVRGRSSGDPHRACRRCSIRTTARARSTRVQTNGFIDAAPSLARWMSRMPADLTSNIALMLPGVAHDESTDSDAFDCRDAPAFFLTSSDWSYTRLHLAHQPRHVRQDQLRRCEAERDAGRDVRVSGVGGSGHSSRARGECRRRSREPASRCECRSATRRRGVGRRRSGRRSCPVHRSTGLRYRDAGGFPVVSTRTPFNTRRSVSSLDNDCRSIDRWAR